MKHSHHIHPTATLIHEHDYASAQARSRERRAGYVVTLTLCMMLLEIACGIAFNSMALIADGWHMSTHAGALGIAAFAYFFARKQAGNPRFTFGTGKVNALGGFTSAVILAMIALLVAFESCGRLAHPRPILFSEAIAIALLGLCVNLASAWLLRDNHAHDHEHGHNHPDHNMRAAYLHVLADAVTSLLTVSALVLAKLLGWIWLDPLIGIVGSLVIAHWAIGLMRQTSLILLDHTDISLGDSIRSHIERDSDNKITDLHLWQIAPGKHSVIISLVTDEPRPPLHYKQLLKEFDELVHVTIEVNPCGLQ